MCVCVCVCVVRMCVSLLFTYIFIEVGSIAVFFTEGDIQTKLCTKEEEEEDEEEEEEENRYSNSNLIFITGVQTLLYRRQFSCAITFSNLAFVYEKIRGDY